MEEEEDRNNNDNQQGGRWGEAGRTTTHME
jgi:hypothetical protein